MFKNKSISRSIFVSSDNQNLSQPFITGKLQICPMEYLNAVFRKLSVVPYNSAGTEKVCWKQGEICLRNNSKIHSRSLHFREEISGGVGVDFIFFFFPLWIRYYRPASVREIAVITENNTTSRFSCSHYYYHCTVYSFSLRPAVAITEKRSIKIGRTE